MFPQTEREGKTSREGARRCSSSRENAERSLKSSGEEMKDEISSEASIIDSKGGSSEDLGKNKKRKI